MLSLDGVTGSDERNKGRLQKFREYWHGQCGPSVEFEFCPGVMHPIGGPSRAKFASWSLRRALLMPQANPVSLYRCGKRT